MTRTKGARAPLEIPNVFPVPAEEPRRPVAVLFIHGMWHGHWCWLPLAEWLAARGIACYLLDLPGHGARRVRVHRNLLTLGHYARDLARTAKALRANLPADTRIVWVAHSMGGAVVQKCLERETVSPPDGLALLASVAPSGVGLATWRLLWSRHWARVLKAILFLNLYVLIRNPAHAKALLFSPTFPEERVADYLRAGKLQNDSILAYAGMLLMGFSWKRRARRLRARLRDAGAPVLALSTEEEQDAIIPWEDTQQIVEEYDAEHHPFPLAHDLMLDEGERGHWQSVAERLHRWLTKMEGGPAV